MRAAARIGLLLAGLLAACGGEPTAGPVDPVWDRDGCERCRMTIGDRQFAAQVRMDHDGGVRHFDDLGCALLWLGDETAAGRAARESWVRDRGADRWLDATTARFAAGHRSPMAYGFAAVADGDHDLEAVRRAVQAREDERRRPSR